MYTICIQPNAETNSKPDYLAIIDVDPNSTTYSQVMKLIVSLLPNSVFLIKHYL